MKSVPARVGEGQDLPVLLMDVTLIQAICKTVRQDGSTIRFMPCVPGSARGPIGSQGNTPQPRKLCIVVLSKQDSWESQEPHFQASTRDSSKRFPYSCSFNPHNNRKRQTLYQPSFSHQGSEAQRRATCPRPYSKWPG